MKTYKEFLVETSAKTPEIFNYATNSSVQFLDYSMNVINPAEAKKAFEKTMKTKGFTKTKGPRGFSSWLTSDGFKVSYFEGSKGIYNIQVSSADAYNVKPEKEISSYAKPILSDMIKVFSK